MEEPPVKDIAESFPPGTFTAVEPDASSFVDVDPPAVFVDPSNFSLLSTASAVVGAPEGEVDSAVVGSKEGVKLG